MPGDRTENYAKLRHGRILAVGVWLIPLVILAVGTRHWIPPLASEHGAGIDTMLRYLLLNATGLLLISHLALGYFLWRFGGQGRVAFRPISARQERNWTLVPVILMAVIAEGGVLVLGLPVWAKLYDTAPTADAVTVEVTAEQFAWNVRYPGKDGKFGRKGKWIAP